MTDNLQERAQRAQEEAQLRRKNRILDAHYSRTARIREDIATSGRFMSQVYAGLSWLNIKVFQPCLRAGMWIAIRIARLYMRLWAFFVYRRTPDQILIFSKTRAGLLIAGTIGCLYISLPVLGFIYQAVLYAATVRVDEKVYLLGSQEINSQEGTHTIEGCSELPCNNHDAIYYRTENTWFHHVWSLARGEGIFFAEYVGAAVPYATSACVITSYGFRFKITSRIFNVYPYMLAVSCSGDVSKFPK
jgi:hypothetical protein